MNGYQRISQVLNGKRPDRVPIMLHNFLPAARESGFSQKEFRSSPEIMAECFINTNQKYGLDGILTDVDTALLAGACGAQVDFPDDGPARVVGPAGSDVREIISHIDEDTFLQNERIQVYLQAIRIISDYCGDEVYLRGNADQGPFSLAFLLYGMENFLMDILDDSKQDEMRSLLEKCYSVSLRFHREVKKSGAHCTSFGDSPAGPDLCSPDIYRRLARPYQDRLARALKKEGIQTICHICGNVDQILTDMATTEIAGFELDYKTDVNKIRDTFRGEMVFFGNLDPVGVIGRGNPDQVKQKTIELIDFYKKTGGFVLAAGCALPADTPEENIRAMVAAVEEAGYYQ